MVLQQYNSSTVAQYYCYGSQLWLLAPSTPCLADRLAKSYYYYVVCTVVVLSTTITTYFYEVARSLSLSRYGPVQLMGKSDALNQRGRAPWTSCGKPRMPLLIFVGSAV